MSNTDFDPNEFAAVKAVAPSPTADFDPTELAANKTAAPSTGFDPKEFEQHKATALEKAVEPITSYPDTYLQMNRDAREQFGRGVDQLSNPKDLWDAAKGVANAGMGALGYVGSPVNAALRTFVGKPVEENTGIPKEYPEFAAALMLPGAGLTKLPKGVPAKASVATPLSPGQEIAAASQRLGVPVPKAAATDSIPLQATAGAIKEMPIIGTPLVKASRDAVAGIEGAVGDTAGTYGSGTVFSGGQAAKAGITNWITDKSSAIADRLYSTVDQYIDPAVKVPLSATKQAVYDISAKNLQAGLPPGKAVDTMRSAFEQAGQQFPYEAIKTLRSRVGEMSEGGILPEGMSKGDLKQLYGALTTDLRGAAQAAGGDEGLAAFDKANRLYSQIAAKRETLASIVGSDAQAAPEKVLDRLVQMASGKSGADILKLTQARKAMGAENWGEVTAGLINRMGRVAEDGDFSGARFITSWNNLSDAGKRLLFNSVGNEGGAKAMEDLVTLSKAHKRLLDYGNPSGTGRLATVGALMGGLWAEPVTALASALGGNMFARVMSSPATVRASVDWAKKYSTLAQTTATPMAKSGLAQATANLAQKISSQTGMDPLLIFKRLQLPSSAPAQDDGGQPPQRAAGGGVDDEEPPPDPPGPSAGGLSRADAPNPTPEETPFIGAPSPDAYIGADGRPKITVRPEPKAGDYGVVGTPDSTGMPFLDKLIGAGGQERFQTWPEKMVRSGASLAHDALSGEVASRPGARREDYTDIPPPQSPDENSPWLARKLNIAPGAWSPQDDMIERAQDMAGMAGSAGMPLSEAGALGMAGGKLKPAIRSGDKIYADSTGPLHVDVKAPQRVWSSKDAEFGFVDPSGEFLTRDEALAQAQEQGLLKKSDLDWEHRDGGLDSKSLKLRSDSSEAGAPLSALEKGQPFYSAVEKAITTAPQAKATPEQWVGYLKNQPGVKPEEMKWLGVENWLKEQKGPVSREDLQNYIDGHKIEVKDALNTNKGPEFEDAYETAQELQDNWAHEAPNFRLKQEGNHYLIETDEGHRIAGPFGSKDMAAEELEKYKKAFGGDDDTAGAEDYRRDAISTAAYHMAERSDTGRYAEYQLPGGKNYNELLLTLPFKKAEPEKAIADQVPEFQRQHMRPSAYAEKPADVFQSSHWEEPNVLAHARFNDRTINGKKALFLEEVQSDWHQQGRKHGYVGDELSPEHLKNHLEGLIENGILDEPVKVPGTDTWAVRHYDQSANHPASKQKVFDSKKEADDFLLNYAKDHYEGIAAKKMSQVPDAPLKASSAWSGLVLKRMIRYAAENGHDTLAWTPGEVQNKRWPGDKDHGKFYDEILVNAANKLAKPFGSQVGKSKIKTSELNDSPHPPTRASDFTAGQKREQQVHTLEITPSMRKAALAHGFPLFTDSGKTGAPLSALEKAKLTQALGSEQAGPPSPVLTQRLTETKTAKQEAGQALVALIKSDPALPPVISGNAEKPNAYYLQPEVWSKLRSHSLMAEKVSDYAAQIAKLEAEEAAVRRKLPAATELDSGSPALDRLVEDKPAYKLETGAESPYAPELWVYHNTTSKGKVVETYVIPTEGQPQPELYGGFAVYKFKGEIPRDKVLAEYADRIRYDFEQDKEPYSSPQEYKPGDTTGWFALPSLKHSTPKRGHILWDVFDDTGNFKGGVAEPTPQKAISSLGKVPIFKSDSGKAGAPLSATEKSKDQKVPGPVGQQPDPGEDSQAKARAAGGRVNADNIDHNPTEAQKAAGNYSKDHVSIHGLDITIENAKGSKRRGVSPEGEKWEAVLPVSYGYFKRSEGADGDHVDVYLGPHKNSAYVFVIDQIDLKARKFDETKVIMGAGSKQQALNWYERAFSDGKGKARIGAIHTITVSQLKLWLESGDTTVPFKLPKVAKLSHSEVGYERVAANPYHRCGSCKHFIPTQLGGPDCTLVAKPILPGGWCRRFRSKGA